MGEGFILDPRFRVQPIMVGHHGRSLRQLVIVHLVKKNTVIEAGVGSAAFLLFYVI